MIETSKDILFIALAFCAVFFTAFLCWLLYYLVAITRDAYNITNSIKKKIDLLDDILVTIKEKINHTANYLALAVNGVEKIVDYLQKKKSNRDENSKKKNKNKTTTEEQSL